MAFFLGVNGFRSPRSFRVFLIALVMAGAVGCSGQPAAPPVEPRLAVIQQRVFDRYCATAGCHSGYFPEQRLTLEKGSARESLVGVPSRQRPEMLRVAPGRPADSYLLRKLKGEECVGERMPTGRGPLPPETVEAIRLWIEKGAPDD